MNTNRPPFISLVHSNMTDYIITNGVILECSKIFGIHLKISVAVL
jgi:hypothetical protein